MKNHLNNQFKKIERQNGIALFIALAFLFVSTLLGVSSLRSNLFSEKMTLNSIQRDEALEVAEAALLEAEDIIETSNAELLEALLNNRVPTNNALQCETTFEGQGGICVYVEATADFDGTNYDHWRDIEGDSNSIEAWSTAGRYRELDDPALVNQYGLNNPPKYIIEFMGFSAADSDPTNSGCVQPSVTDTNVRNEVDAWPYCSLDRSIYRITALATTGNYDETRVMLQSTYVVDNE